MDGRNGKTITNERVQVWINDSKRARSLIPGKDGIVEVDARAGSRIQVEANLYFDCRPFEKDAARPSYSVDETKSGGIATQNTCGKLATEARHGELLFFVRPIHWWQGMRR